MVVGSIGFNRWSSKSYKIHIFASVSSMKKTCDVVDVFNVGEFDYPSHIPDECLASIFLAQVTRKVLPSSVVVGIVSKAESSPSLA
ncbi:hypothetical protein MTR67_041237 [Solanum verrucosum]|uniref:Uncharacterized protein n=1 Tax=Solanum verrucosum TaxID=315347 RepID=A0AAF0ZQ49_SOLVR|nr:hypothetical protein MTR67_041237 [Solanum verrucosum]